MSMDRISNDISRRTALKVLATAGGGFAIALALPTAAIAKIGSPLDQLATDGATTLHAFIRIASDNAVTIVCGKAEMGQGALTGFAQVVADELDCAWRDITVVPSPVHPAYGNPPKGFMATGGSTTIRLNWMIMRQAGAAARLMLRRAAAKQWGVSSSKVRTKSGRILGPAGRNATFGEMAALAAKEPIPGKPPLKRPSERNFIGKPVKRVDTAQKVDGTAKFGIDVRLPGMKTAVIAFPPDIGGKVDRVDDGAARKVPGVRDIVQIASGVAIVADNYWAAIQGRNALKVTWRPGPFSGLDTEAVRASYKKALQGTGKPAERRGDTRRAAAARVLEMTYEQPYLAHACMEPMNCTVQVTSEGADVWVPTQSQMLTQRTIAAVTGLPPSKIRVHTMLLGGGFGRRSAQDFVRNAAEIAKATKVPVRLVYSREDDMRAAFFRPFNMTQVQAKLDSDDNLVALDLRVAVPSVAKWTGFKFLVRPDGIDSQAVEGLHGLPYAVPNLSVDWVEHDPGIPIWFWRAVGASHNPFVAESVIDEIAHATKRDPYKFRRGLLARKPRHRAVLDRVAERARWSTPTPKGTGRGIALVESFGSICAQVADVRLANGRIRVDRVTCAIDCGTAINPQQIAAQMESNIVYGLSALLDGEITLKEGRVEQENFDTYEPLRMHEMPKIDVEIMESGGRPGGVGEPGLPPLLPAVANAVFALTGKRHRRLPLMRNTG